MKEVILKFFAFALIFLAGYQSLLAQGMAKFTFNNGKEQRLSIQTYPMQTDKFVRVIDVKTGKEGKVALDSLRSIFIEANEEIKEPALFVPINVYVNKTTQFRRWVELIYSSDYITIFQGVFAKGIKRVGNVLTFYKSRYHLAPQTYYYFQRLGEQYASVWFYHNADDLTNNISKKEFKRFIKQSVRYFERTPNLTRRIKNKEFGPADWKKLIKVYEEEVQSVTKTNNYNI